MSYAPHERQLLVAVVHFAVHDACLKPAGKPPHPLPEALDGVDFLFRTNAAGLDAYAQWIDLDAGQFRHHLLEVMSGRKVPGISEVDARALRFNYDAWRREAR